MLLELVGTRGHLLKLVFAPCYSDVCSTYVFCGDVFVLNGFHASIVQFTDITHCKKDLADLMSDEFSKFDYLIMLMDFFIGNVTN